MKKLFCSLAAACALLLHTQQLAAQTPNPCGTEQTGIEREWLLDYAANGRGVAHKQAVQYYVPMHFHIVGNNDDKGFYSASQLMMDLCELNRQYAEVGFYFYLAGVSYISNNAYFDHNYNDGYDMMQNYNEPDVANVYVVLNPADNCGYYAGFVNGVAVGKNCMGTGATTLAHEMGHFFSLPHPFTNVTGVDEYVNGSNCAVAGDLFCDTRADYLNTRWPCPYTGTKLDPLGDPYDPDETLFMSYSSDHCAHRFSPEQIDAMHYNILGKRANLQGPVQDTMPAIQRVTRVWPAEGAMVKPTQAQFSWKSVPGAGWYVLQVSQISVFPNNLPVEVITRDTFYTATNLGNNVNYRWRVRPIYAGRTCTGFSDTGSFKATINTAIEGFTTGDGLKLYPNPAAAGSEVFVALENEATEELTATVYTIDGKTIARQTLSQQGALLYSLNISGLAPGFYFADIRTGNTLYRQKLLVE